MSLATLHADARPLSKEIGNNLQKAEDLSLLTNATVAAADTNAGLQTAVSAVSVHADQKQISTSVNNAIAEGKESGELSDARILALTTTDGAIDLTNASSAAPIRGDLSGD